MAPVPISYPQGTEVRGGKMASHSDTPGIFPSNIVSFLNSAFLSYRLPNLPAFSRAVLETPGGGVTGGTPLFLPMSPLMHPSILLLSIFS